MITAFQRNAFQSNAFQVEVVEQTGHRPGHSHHPHRSTRHRKPYFLERIEEAERLIEQAASAPKEERKELLTEAVGLLDETPPAPVAQEWMQLESRLTATIDGVGQATTAIRIARQIAETIRKIEEDDEVMAFLLLAA